MTPTPVPSPSDLRIQLLARLHEMRRALDHTADGSFPPAAEEGEYQGLRAALDDLERRIREILSE